MVKYNINRVGISQMFRMNRQSIFLLALALLFACSSSSKNYRPMPKENSSLVIPNYYELKDVLANPSKYKDGQIAINGVVHGYAAEKASGNVTLFTILVSPIGAKPIFKPAQNSNDINFAIHLIKSEQVLKKTLKKPAFLAPKVAIKLRDLSYDFKIAANEIRAISHYYRSNNLQVLATASDEVAKGFSAFGDAYKKLAESALHSPIVHDIRVTDKLTLKRSEDFEEQVLKLAEQLLNAASLMITVKEQLAQGLIVFKHQDLPDDLSHALLSYSHKLKANSWAYKKMGKVDYENASSLLSQSFNKFGTASKSVKTGFFKMGEELQKQIKSTQKALVYPTLKCAYYGNNSSHLQRASAKLKHIKGKYPITIYGQLSNENLLEQVDVTWMKISAIELDGLTIVMDYGAKNSTLQSAGALYEWVDATKKGAK